MRKLFYGLLAAATALFPLAGQTTGTFAEHKRLYDTIHSFGVRVVINHPKYCVDSVDGSYHSYERILSICQDNADYSNRETDWTANDLDTLRHEAHHMIQDCALGGLGDAQLSLLFGDMTQAKAFVQSVLPESQQRRLMGLDTYSGHNAYRQMIELEAFATAAAISPTDITEKMIEVCR